MVFAEEYISVSVVFLVNGLLVLSSSPSTGNTNIIASVSPRGNQGFSLHVQSCDFRVGRLCILMSPDLPRKAPSVLFLARCFRAVGGGIRVKINKVKKRKKFIIKTPRINGVRRLTALNENSSSPVPVSGLPPWHLTNRGSQGTINPATILIPID